MTIVRAIMLLGRALKMGVVAEGVETQAQLDALAGLDCAEVQGFIFGPPVPADAVPGMFQDARWPPVESPHQGPF
jgi:EAL domain-containing protein (putative c-di-GMP-specific phosphodiesterase class I)